MTARGTYQTAGRFLLIILNCVWLTACNPTPKITDKDVTIIDDVQLVELIESEPSVLLVDARPDYRYRIGHLPGAVNIPLPEVNADDPRFTKGQHVVVYGDGPRNTLSHAAAKKLLAGGKLIVSDFRGGYEMWKQAGREIATDY